MCERKDFDLTRFEEDSEWVTKNYDGLRKTNQGKIIAVMGKAIIAVSDDIHLLIETLHQKNVNPACILLEAFPPKDTAFIL
jgi:hypothetical protein